MPTLVYRSRKHPKSESLSVYSPDRQAHILACKLIDRIILDKKRKPANVLPTRTFVVKTKKHPI